MPDVIIRRCTPADAETVCEMINELEEESFDEALLEAQYLQNLQSNDIHYWIAESGDTKLGVVSVYFHVLLHHNGPVAEIQELFVAKNARRHGIGKRLVSEVRRDALDRRCKLLEVTSNQVNREEAHRFYEREGFLKSHYKFTMPL